MGVTRIDIEPSSDGTGTGIRAGLSIKPHSDDSVATAVPGCATKPPMFVGKGKSSRSSGVDRKTMWCSHCGKFRHSKAECFQLIGLPKGWKSQQMDGISVGNLVMAMNDRDGREKGIKCFSIEEEGTRVAGARVPSNEDPDEIGKGLGRDLTSYPSSLNPVFSPSNL